MGTVRQYWDKTSGYKTTSSGVVLLLFQLFKLLFPDKLSPEWEEFTLNAIGLLAATGLLDKAWRNRKEIKEKLKSLFTKNKED